MLLNSNSLTYGTAIISLFAIDYVLGHGFVDIIRRCLCRMLCFIKKTIREEAKNMQTVTDVQINLPALVVEVLLLYLIVVLLHKYKQLRHKDPIDDLLQKSREALQRTNDYLDKWRLKRVPMDFTYLEEDSVKPKTMTMEVPILKMAVVDKNEQERKDAGDSVEIPDTTLLSVTSLVCDNFDFKSVSEGVLEGKVSEEARPVKFRNRYLWDVMEEDANILDE